MCKLFCLISFLKVNLGNGLFETIMKNAKGKFIAEKFAQLQECHKKPHDLIVVPPAYLFNEWTEKVHLYLANRIKCIWHLLMK